MLGIGRSSSPCDPRLPRLYSDYSLHESMTSSSGRRARSEPTSLGTKPSVWRTSNPGALRHDLSRPESRLRLLHMGCRHHIGRNAHSETLKTSLLHRGASVFCRGGPRSLPLS